MKRSAYISIAVTMLFALPWIPALRAGFAVDGAPICTASGNQENLYIAADFEGGAVIAWEDNRDYRDIYAQRIDRLGRALWAKDGIGVCTYSYGQYGPSIAPDLAGGAFIAWQDGRPHPDRDIYVQHIDAAGGALWIENGLAVCTAANYQYGPQVCFDGAGGCIVAWHDARTSALFDVYAQRIKSDGSPAWTANGVLVCGAAGIQQQVRIVPDGKGGAIIVWEDYRSEGDIYAQKVRPDGSVAWTPNGVPVCAATGKQSGPDIAFDNHFGAVVTWSDERGFYDIYAQRIDSAGNALWTASGVPLCTDAEWQNYPRVAADYEGGAIVTWLDQRVGDFDCWAQRVGSNGEVKWTPDGVPVCTAPGGCTNIGILGDGRKGAIITWNDNRNGYMDIFAQAIDSAGASRWTTNGIALCTAENNQQEPVLCPDAGFGAIVAWKDFRAVTHTDVYAARIDYDGSLVATLLAGSSAAWRDGVGVEIAWTLAEQTPRARFAVLRARAADRVFAALDPGGIESAGRHFSFIDREAEPGETYVYRVDVTEDGAARTLFETGSVSIPAARFVLRQNRPNPFNPSTLIEFELPAPSRVSLRIYDAAGRLVRVLAEGPRAAGRHAETWDGRDAHGRELGSGVYVCRLEAAKRALSRKMVLLR